MYENKKEPLLPLHKYYKRVTTHVLLAGLILLVCLMIGVFGYHYAANIAWLDSLHNASMILSGMGPVVEVKTVAGKWFSSFYALFSGIAFITNFGVLIVPVAHRFFHKLHLEQ